MPLITFEGIDGSGKTTQIEMLRQFLEANGVRVHVFKEPGGTPAGEVAREMLLHGDYDLHPLAQLMLFQFSRAELVHKELLPLLKSGATILLDRYMASSATYQGYALAQQHEIETLNMRIVQQACEIATGGLLPDMEIYLDVNVPVAYERMTSEALDNFEVNREMMQMVADGYRLWYTDYCNYPYILVSADADAKTVHQQVLQHVWANNDII